jgi:hypothetical protein
MTNENRKMNLFMLLSSRGEVAKTFLTAVAEVAAKSLRLGAAPEKTEEAK